MPTEEAMQLLRERKVICLLDDLNNFGAGTVDLLSFQEKLGAVASHVALAGTCRDGGELAALEHMTSSPLHEAKQNLLAKK